MSRLYIVFYDKLEAQYIPSSTDILLNIKDNHDKILHVINKDQFDNGSLNPYYQLYQEYENINKVIICDFSTTLKEILKNEIQKYENIVIYSCKLYFTKKIKNLINDIGYIVPENNTSISLGSFSRQSIIDMMRTDQTISNIKNILEIGIENSPSYKTNLLIDSSKISQKQSVEDSVFYEDSNCLFCTLGKRDDISRSAVYMNKNNQKVFNINNNIFGNVLQYSGSFISIDWKINNQNKACYYHKHNGNFDN